MSFFGQRLNVIGPHQRDGLLGLCALDPVCAVALAHQLRRWDRWGDGDVVVLGRPSRPVAGAWATGSLMPFGLAARPALGHDGVGPSGARAIADHARLRLTRRGSIMGAAGINISSMQVGKSDRKGMNIMVLTIDHDISDDVLARVLAVEGIFDAKLVNFEAI